MKILNRLTLKNLRMNKTRTIVTMIGIMLSAALITVVAGMATSAQQTFIGAQINISGNYDLSVSGINTDDISQLNNNRDIEGIYLRDEIGCAKLDGAKNDYRPYVGVRAFDKNAFDNCFSLTLTNGRYPQNDSEILLTQKMLDNTTKKYSVGDKITLQYGTRTDNTGFAINNELPLATDEKDLSKSVETFVPAQTKEYTVVGIIDDTLVSNDIEFNSSSACTTAVTFIGSDYSSAKNLTAFLRFTPQGEANYSQVSSQITGIPESDINDYYNGESDFSTVELAQTAGKYDDFSVNTTLLGYKGYGLGDATMQMLYTLVAIIVLIIIIASVFVIRNSFAISITEKTKLYGMLSSTGATSKQIRHNVLFEGFVLGIIAIPLGILLGVGVCALLVVILNAILGDMLNGILFTYSVPLLPMAFAVVLSAITIFLSTITTALRASRISPITAIRGNSDVKIKKKKIKSSKFIKKMFGVGGDIANKNLKRSKKKYRTTVISIVVSVALFIAMSSFVNYGAAYSANYYSQIDYNFLVQTYDSPTKNCYKEYDSILKLDNISKSIYERSIYSTSSDLVKYATVEIVSVGDSMYREILKLNNLSYDDVKDKGIIINKNNDADSVDKYSKYDISKGTEIGFDDNDLKIEIAGVANELPDDTKYTSFDDGSILISDSMMDSMDKVSTYKLSIQTDNADALEKSVNDLAYTDIQITNYETFVKQNNALVLIIGIFIYGFIIVISLIGITNIFNTISTNMRLRSKEFAMLKSIGMTKKEFNKMIRLESLFYGAKSLIIGIPLGLLGTFGIMQAFNIVNDFSFSIPWIPILISIAFVFIVVWLIMKFSIKKVSKQNIIDTIRNDNI